MIAIICSRVRIEEKMIFEAFRSKHKEFVRIDYRTVNLGNFYRHNTRPDLVLNREISQTKAELMLEYFKELGVDTVNSYDSTVLCNNKAMSSWRLKKYSIPTPKTSVVFSAEQAISVAESFGYPVVVKPLIGSWGRLLAKVENRDTLEAILEHKEAMQQVYHSVFYIQEYVSKPGRDIRVIVAGKKPVTAMYRQSEHWITNTARGAKPKPCLLNSDIIEIVDKTVKAFGVEIAGIDLVETTEGYKVLEVNSAVEFHGIQTVSSVDIAGRIVDYLLVKEKNLLKV